MKLLGEGFMSKRIFQFIFDLLLIISIFLIQGYSNFNNDEKFAPYFGSLSVKGTDQMSLLNNV